MADRAGNGERLFQQLRDLLKSNDTERLRSFLADLHAADVADCLEQVDPEQRSHLLFLLPPRMCAEAIVLLEEAVRSDVLDDLTDEEVSDVLKQLPADDVVDVLEELDEDVADKVIEQLPPEQKAAVEPLRRYDESSAGGIMDPDFVSVPDDACVADAIDEIRQLSPEDADAVFYIYCVDGTGRLKGLVPPLRLLTAASGTPVQSLLQHDLLTVHVEDDQEAVKNKFEKYDVVALPVVDDGGQMLGVITHDDVLEVAEDEAEEDMLYMAGTQPEEFATASPFHAASVRARWLLPCLAGTLVSITVMFLAEPALGALFLFLIPFNSPIAAMGGNAGVQTSTVIVRALATGDAIASSVARAFAREFRIAMILGLSVGVLSGLGSYAVVYSGMFDFSHAHVAPPSPIIGVAVGISMTIGILVASTLAMTLPFLFRRMGIDPAIATGPLITTLNDGLSATIYMLIAIALLSP